MSASNTNRIFVWRGSGASGATVETRFDEPNQAGGYRGRPSRSDLELDERRFYWNDPKNWFTIENVFDVPQGGESTESPEYVLSDDGLSLFDPVNGVTLTSAPPDFGASAEGPSDDQDNAVSVYTQASRIPSGGDIVIFKRYTVDGVEYPLSPCILGGFLDGSWVNGTGTGNDATGNLTSLFVESSYSRGRGEDSYPGYPLGRWFGGSSSALSVDGKYWSGLYVRSNTTTTKADHQPIKFKEIHGTKLNIFGSASHSFEGASLSSYLNETENLIFLSEDFLREVHPDIGYNIIRVYYISGNVTDLFDYSPKRLENCQTLFNINTGGITLETLNWSPNYVSREADGTLYQLNCKTLNVSPSRFVSPVVTTLYRCYPALYRDIKIENLNIKDRNDKYDIELDARVGIFQGTIDNLIMDGGSFNIGGNLAGNFGSADVDVKNVVVKKGQVNLITNDRLNQDIQVGVSGATTPFTGILSYDKNSSVSFPSGSVIKTFSGASGASGGETGGGIENVISTSNKPIRELLSQKLDYLDLTGSGA